MQAILDRARRVVDDTPHPPQLSMHFGNGVAARRRAACGWSQRKTASVRRVPDIVSVARRSRL